MSLKADHNRHVALLGDRQPLDLRSIAHPSRRELPPLRDGHSILSLLLLHFQHQHHLLLLQKYKMGIKMGINSIIIILIHIIMNYNTFNNE